MYKVTRAGYKAKIIFTDGTEVWSRLFPLSDKELLNRACNQALKSMKILTYEIHRVEVETEAN